ncbi:hypothetical protein [uncultured Deinococcus sp.]|uniref:hypothetical protein n=1 Tax=uncultured Deinococcus sp. TaxID=158789 RepID=UPI0025DDBE59|nr:hypothetical protein [uncultured Deinococcus sp.]
MTAFARPLPALVCLALGSPALAQASRPLEATVEVTATAATRDAALRQLVTLGVDALFAQVITPGTPASTGARKAVPDSLARIVRIIREGATPQGYAVTGVVALPAGTAERAVLARTPALTQTRIAVLIPESILRRPVPDPAAETEISRALVGAGLKVVDLSTSLRLNERETLRAGPSGQTAWVDLKSRLAADVLVTGEAFAEEYGNVAGGTRGYTSRLEVKVIDLSSGQVLHSQAYQGSGIGATDALAGKTALMNVGRAAGTQLPATLIRALQSAGPTAPRAFTVRIKPPVTFGTVQTLITKLSAQRGVSVATLRNIDAAGAVLDVTYQGAATDLAGLLERLGLSVTGLNGLDLSARF